MVVECDHDALPAKDRDTTTLHALDSERFVTSLQVHDDEEDEEEEEEEEEEEHAARLTTAQVGYARPPLGPGKKPLMNIPLMNIPVMNIP